MLPLVLALAASFQHPGRPLEIRRYAESGWRLEVRHDRFRGQTACRLSGRRLIYQPGAIGFATNAFGTASAWYSIDGTPAQAWSGLLAELRADHVQLDAGGLDDPTGGYVWIPFRLVEHASLVAIETGTARSRRVVRFRMEGLASMHAAALRLGCPPDGFRV